MEPSEAREVIAILTEADTCPKLSDYEIDLLLDKAWRPDSSLLTINDDGWQPTWDMNAAVSLGWRMKAGKVATAYDFRSGTQQFSRSQMYKMCLEQAKLWRSSSAVSLQLVGSLRGRDARSRGLNEVETNASDDFWWSEPSFSWWRWSGFFGWW